MKRKETPKTRLHEVKQCKVLSIRPFTEGQVNNASMAAASHNQHWDGLALLC